MKASRLRPSGAVVSNSSRIRPHRKHQPSLTAHRIPGRTVYVRHPAPRATLEREAKGRCVSSGASAAANKAPAVIPNPAAPRWLARNVANLDVVKIETVPRFVGAASARDSEEQGVNRLQRGTATPHRYRSSSFPGCAGSRQRIVHVQLHHIVAVRSPLMPSLKVITISMW